MRAPLEWLKEYVAIRLSPQALAQRLTLAGLEISAIEQTPHGPVFDIEVTPNRPDWLSILGIAREVAAITGERLTLPSVQGSGFGVRNESRKPTAHSPEPRAAFSIHIEDKQGCLRYVGRLINGIRVKPSPPWMQVRLIACGARPINNIVDITNYVLFEYGQPLHAFDAEDLAALKILVRRARENEPLTTLDGVSRKLSGGMLVIADAKKAVAIAGIMGGQASGVTEGTKAIVLESALFDPVTVRRTARQLGLSSDSSYRFERGVDPEAVATASERAAVLIAELAGGFEEAVAEAGVVSKRRVAIAFEPAKAQKWLGMSLDASTLRTSFARLGCRVAGPDTAGLLSISPPSYRGDLAREVDLYEEIARVIGYDRIRPSIPVVSLTYGATPARQFASAQQLRRFCASVGLTEVITWSLIAESDAVRCGWTLKEVVRLANPLSQDHAVLRPGLLAGMLQVVRRNLAQGISSLSLFEIGNVTAANVSALEAEQGKLGLMLSGAWLRDWRATDASDFFRLKGLLQAIAVFVGAGEFSFISRETRWAEPVESAAIEINGGPTGQVGLVLRSITHALDIEQDVWFAEMSIAPLLSAKSALRVRPPSLFPPVKRDLSIVVSRDVTYQTLYEAVRESAGPWALRVELIDRYTGKQVPDGKYSATFSIEYRNTERTLTAAEVDTVHGRIAQALHERFGAIRR